MGEDEVGTLRGREEAPRRSDRTQGRRASGSPIQDHGRRLPCRVPQRRECGSLRCGHPEGDGSTEHGPARGTDSSSSASASISVTSSRRANDVYGDGVNVAARIEGLAPPGGVAVSAMVHDNIGNRLDLTFEDIGEQQLKNIARAGAGISSSRHYKSRAATNSCRSGQAVDCNTAVRQPQRGSRPTVYF